MPPAIAYETLSRPVPPYASAKAFAERCRSSVPNHSPYVQREQNEGNAMPFTRTNTGPTVGRDNSNNSCQPHQDADVIFLKDWANRYSAKEGAALTDMTPNGFKKLQSGESAISYKKITEWMRRDPDFAAAYAEHIGLIRPGEAEFAGALTKAFNAYQRRGDRA